MCHSTRALTVAVLVLAASCGSTPERADSGTPEHPRLAARILAEWSTTEEIWERLARAEELTREAQRPVDPEQLYLQLARQLSVDQRVLEEAINELGWPTPGLVGESAARAAVGIAVNAPPNSALAARAMTELQNCADFEGRASALEALHTSDRTRTTAWVVAAPPAASVTPMVALVPEPVAHPRIAAELLAMRGRDQEVRFEVASLLRDAVGHDRPPGALGLVAKQQAVDAENLERLEEIVADIGWPTDALVGSEAARAAWTLAQHADSDPEFQARVLGWIKPLAGTEGVPYSDVALLTDRVRVARKEPQLFGTQWLVTPIDGVMHFGPITPIEDREHLAERRELVGLPPLEDYLEILREAYGVPEDAPPLWGEGE